MTNEAPRNTPILREAHTVLFDNDTVQETAQSRAALQTQLAREAINRELPNEGLQRQANLAQEHAKRQENQQELVQRVLRTTSPEAFANAIKPLYVYTLTKTEAEAYKYKLDQFIPDSVTPETITPEQRAILQEAMATKKATQSHFVKKSIHSPRTKSFANSSVYEALCK